MKLPVELEILIRGRELAASGEARRLREKAGLSLSEVGAACGATPSAVSRWETGKRRPQGPHARRYAEVVCGLDSRGRDSTEITDEDA